MSRPISIEYLDEIQLGFNQHDVDAILSHFANDCVWLMARGPNAPEGRRCVGKVAWEKMVIECQRLVSFLITKKAPPKRGITHSLKCVFFNKQCMLKNESLR